MHHYDASVVSLKFKKRSSLHMLSFIIASLQANRLVGWAGNCHDILNHE